MYNKTSESALLTLTLAFAGNSARDSLAPFKTKQ